jgi:hypothetical protein
MFGALEPGNERMSERSRDSRRSHGRWIAAIAISPLVALVASFYPQRASHALPIYARRYDVSCDTCHSVAPRLNKFGLAFQANHFRWPGGEPPAHRETLSAIPISALATFSRVDETTFHFTSTNFFDTLDLFASDGFTLSGPERAGGYFIDDTAIIQGGGNGQLQNAFVSVPIAGSQGQFALTAGQFSPMSYQYDQINRLSQSIPAALGNAADEFSFVEVGPGVRMEYFDHRGQTSPSGNYVSIGVPFEGYLTLNSSSALSSTTHGIYAHAFRRWGDDSIGAFDYTHDGRHLAGLLGTKGIGDKLDLLAGVSSGHDEFGSTDAASIAAEYSFNQQIALSGHIDSTRGDGQPRQTYPVATVTVCPFSSQFIRVTGETIQVPGNRSVSVYLFGQL